MSKFSERNRAYAYLISSLLSCVLWLSFGMQTAVAGSYDDFFIAVKNDQTDKVYAILTRGFDPNTIDADGHPALVLAARNKSMNVFDLLLKQKTIKVDVRNLLGETPLMYAAILGRADWVKQIVKQGGQINQLGWTPLHYAASYGHTDIVAWLIEEHAYIDAQSEQGITPLMLAARGGFAPTVKLLLDEGADAYLKMNANKTAMDYATAGNHSESVELLRRAKRP